MDNTLFSKRVNILAALWFFYRDKDDNPKMWQDFFAWADIGLPLAYVASENLATLTDEGMELITETWEAACGILAIDPYPVEMYNTLEDMLNESPDED
jgi:hypothetical protein